MEWRDCTGGALSELNGAIGTIHIRSPFIAPRSTPTARPADNEHNAAYRIVNENLDVSIEKSGLLSSLATIEVKAAQDGVAVIPLDLYPTLRVSRVETDKGEALDFVQEKKDEDPGLRRGARCTAEEGRDGDGEDHL